MTEQPAIRTGELKAENGTIAYSICGTVVCKQYRGKFTVKALQAKADAGLWYSSVMGNPNAIEGEGTTPELATQDAIRRTMEDIRLQTNGIATLRQALKTMQSE